MDRIASITVTFHPEPALLSTQLRALPADQLKLVVDNGTPEDLWARVAGDVANIPRLEVVRLGRNIGLAAAINIGASWIGKNCPATYLLLLDQDSEPQAGSISRLLEAFEALLEKGLRVGAVGADLHDAPSGRAEGFHTIRGSSWRRVFPADGELTECASLNGSGTVTPLELFNSLGGLDESLFIDHVDTEWSFRLRSRGFLMYGVSGARVAHRMGERSARFWFFGWRPWAVRSPLRHRYLFRNSVSLLGRGYVPFAWKWSAIVKLAATLVIFTAAGPQRLRQLRSMVLGIFDGLMGRSGKL